MGCSRSGPYHWVKSGWWSVLGFKMKRVGGRVEKHTERDLATGGCRVVLHVALCIVASAQLV